MGVKIILLEQGIREISMVTLHVYSKVVELVVQVLQIAPKPIVFPLLSFSTLIDAGAQHLDSLFQPNSSSRPCYNNWFRWDSSSFTNNSLDGECSKDTIILDILIFGIKTNSRYHTDVGDE